MVRLKEPARVKERVRRKEHVRVKKQVRLKELVRVRGQVRVQEWSEFKNGQSSRTHISRKRCPGRILLKFHKIVIWGIS